MQDCVGITLTLATTHVVPLVAAAWGRPVAFCLLALGPIAGVALMTVRCARPEALRLAGGRR